MDIALLPSLIDMPELVRRNAEIRQQADGEIRLSVIPEKGQGYPHLSLAMGVLRKKARADLESALLQLSASLELIELPTISYSSRKNSTGGLTSSLDFEKTNELTRLHEACMALAMQHLSHDAVPGDILQASDGDALRSIRWINGFPEIAAHENFSPHITLGYGGPLVERAPEFVVFDRLGLFALGPGCTCREALALFDLSPACS